MNLFRKFRHFVRMVKYSHRWRMTETGLRTKIDGEGETCFCPLTYAYYVASGGVARSVNDYNYCADYLGLPDGELIAVAADDQNEEAAANEDERKIHRILQRACGVRKQQPTTKDRSS